MESRYNTHNNATVIGTLKSGSYRNVAFNATATLKVIAFDNAKKVATCVDTVANIKAAFPTAWPVAYANAPDTHTKLIKVKNAAIVA